MLPSIPMELAFRRLRRLYWWSLALATAGHLILLLLLVTVFSPHGARVPEPAKVKFFTRRDPTLTKPMKIHKVPQPKRQLVRHLLQPTAARMDQVRTAATFDTRSLVASQTPAPALLNPSALAPDRSLAGAGLQPVLHMPGVNPVARTPEQRIDLSLEMIDINSMDTGRYRAMVVQDGRDPQQIKGFVKLASVVPVHIKNSPQYATGMGGAGEQKMLQLLCDALNSYTGLKAEFVGDYTYDDTRILEVPIICRPLDVQGGLGDRNLTPNEAEVQNMAAYLLAGGFFLGAMPPQLLQGLEQYGGLVKGRDFWEARIPDDHPIYTAFFDILGGVPSGNYSGRSAKWDGPYALIGYFLKGRLVSVYPSQGFGWDNYRHNGETTRQMQMAVNIIIYALTQEGSMTQRLMQMVN
ncbi:MAG: DUF4159 domain-containing protein [Candidatus Latescibacteria bacterium]|nr:DUF4159 domain-containing protein [Candidatus Latescibacterota bacterium]